jgi:iron complex outermembrane receptor protein
MFHKTKRRQYFANTQNQTMVFLQRCGISLNRRRRRSNSFLFLCCVIATAGILVTAGPTIARAANATLTADTTLNSGDSLEEIVVTAEKRQSTVQNTPMSITALSGDQLFARGIDSIEQIVQQVPGLSMRSAGPGMTELEMRGLASSGGYAPTVGYYFDDAPLSPPLDDASGKTVVSPAMYDLNRVEVLRGPQGTLYGSGAMGGVVRLISNQPNLEKFSGSIDANASATVGSNGPNGAVNAALNIPIIDGKVALRLVVSDLWNSGWIDRMVVKPFPYPTNNGCTPTTFWGCARGNVSDGHVVADYKDVNWEHTQSARVQLLIQPADYLKILTSVFLQSTYQGAQNLIDVPPGPTGIAAHYQPADIAEPYFDKLTLFSNTISGDLGFAQLTAATTFWTRDQQIVSDIAEGNQSLFFLPNFLTETDQANWLRNPNHQFSEELRMSSESDSALKWVGGLFYSHQASTYFYYGAVKGMCYLSTGGCAANPLGITYYANSPYTVDQYAGFGQVAYTYSAFTATVGGRYFHYKSTFDNYTSGIFTTTGNAEPSFTASNSSDRGFTPKFNLSYAPNKDLTIYATAAQGFRTGGVSSPIPLGTGPVSCLPSLKAIGFTGNPDSFGPDKVWSYELGEKAQLSGGRYSVNADVYYNRWSDIQQPLTLTCGYQFQTNSGTAETYGPELEFSFRVTPEFTIDVNGAYTKAFISKPSASSGIAPGTPILNVPQYTQNTSITYRKGIRDDLVWMVRLGNSLVGKSHDLAFDNYELPAYDLLSARIQLQSGPISYALYGNNVTNTRAQLTSNNTVVDFNIPSVTRVATNQPATVGIEVKYGF